MHNDFYCWKPQFWLSTQKSNKVHRKSGWFVALFEHMPGSDKLFLWFHVDITNCIHLNIIVLFSKAQIAPLLTTRATSAHVLSMEWLQKIISSTTTQSKSNRTDTVALILQLVQQLRIGAHFCKILSADQLYFDGCQMRRTQKPYLWELTDGRKPISNRTKKSWTYQDHGSPPYHSIHIYEYKRKGTRYRHWSTNRVHIPLDDSERNDEIVIAGCFAI